MAGVGPSGFAQDGLAESAVGSGLRLTYLGHATVMIELDGVRLLTDPVLHGTPSQEFCEAKVMTLNPGVRGWTNPPRPGRCAP